MPWMLYMTPEKHKLTYIDQDEKSSQVDVWVYPSAKRDISIKTVDLISWLRNTEKFGKDKIDKYSTSRAREQQLGLNMDTKLGSGGLDIGLYNCWEEAGDNTGRIAFVAAGQGNLYVKMGGPEWFVRWPVHPTVWISLFFAVESEMGVDAELRWILVEFPGDLELKGKAYVKIAAMGGVRVDVATGIVSGKAAFCSSLNYNMHFAKEEYPEQKETRWVTNNEISCPGLDFKVKLSAVWGIFSTEKNVHLIDGFKKPLGQTLLKVNKSS